MDRLDKIDNFCAQAVVWSFCALIFFLPVGIALVESSAAFAIFFYLIKKAVSGIKRVRRQCPSTFSAKCKAFARGLRPDGGFLNGAMNINAAAVFISVLLSSYLNISLFAFVAKYLEGYFLYFSFVECFTQSKQFRKFILFFLISGALASLSGMSQLFTHRDFIRGNVIKAGGVSSSFRHANDFGAYLIVLAFFVIALVKQKFFLDSFARRWRFWFFGLLILTIVCLGLTYSRGTWLGFITAGIIYGFLIKRKRFCFCCLGAFLFIFFPLMVSSRNVSFMSDDIRADHRLVNNIMQKLDAKDSNTSVPIKTSPQSSKRERPSYLKEAIERFTVHWEVFSEHLTGMGRVQFWREAIHIIRNAPAFGMGLNTYSKVAPDYKINWGGYPHNCFLQMAAEVGLIGLWAFLYLIVVFFREAARCLPSMRDPLLKTLVIAGVAGLNGFLLQSFFDTTLYSVQLGNFMWVIVGLVAAAIEADRKLTKQSASL